MESVKLRSHVERQLIKPLFRSPLFSDDNKMVKLAAYPRNIGESREEIILDLIDLVSVFPARPKLLDSYRLLDHFIKASGKRSHFVHQFEVFLLGWYLLQPLVATSRLRKVYFDGSNLKNIQSTWLVTAISHDLGRPFEMAAGISRRLRDLFNEMGMKRTSQLFGSESNDNLLGQEIELTETQIGKTQGYLSKHFSYVEYVAQRVRDSLGLSEGEGRKLSETMRQNADHGYVSGLVLSWASLERHVAKTKGRGLRKSSLVDRLGLAIGAVSTHAIKPGHSNADPGKYIRRLSMKRNPYAYLLFVIDNLQDWSRIAVGERDNAAIELINISRAGKIVTLEYELLHQHWPEATVTRVRRFLREKRQIFRLLRKPSPSLDLEIQVKYRTDTNQLFRPIIISL